MQMKYFLSLLAVAMLFSAPVSAEEESYQPAVCDEKYDQCMDKCAEAPEDADKCYQACDTEYETCLEKQHGN